MFCPDLSSFVLYLVDMYISRASWPSTNGKSYASIYLRESYREGTHVRKRNIANLTHCNPKEIAAIELALRHKNNLTALASLEQIELHQGPSVGAVWTVCQVAERLGLRKILGDEFSGHLTLWQVLARVLEQGPAYRPYAWRRSMPPAPCWAGNAALTKTISTTISPG